MERREYYRVQDLMPLMFKKIEVSDAVRSRIFSGFPISQIAPITTDGDTTTDPNLWNLFVEINNKLNFIVDRLNIESEGLSKAENRHVNLSEGGMRFIVEEKYNVGDLLELKLLLNTSPLTGLVVYGQVKRVRAISDQEYELAVSFLDLPDEIRELLWRYILQRQRPILKKQMDTRQEKLDSQGI